MNETTVFVTGSTGLLGSNTIDALLARGYRVKALARSREKATAVLGPKKGVEVIVGDIEEPNKWISALDGCHALIHTAAYFREYFGRGEHDLLLKKLNVEFPVLLADEALKRGVTRIVMVSSTGVLSGRPDGKQSTESDPANVQIPGNGYQESKRAMESALEKVRVPRGSNLVIVRPGWMWGPNDYAPTATLQIILDMMKTKTFQFVGGTPFGIVDARDVAEGLAALVESKNPKSIYHLAGQNMTALSAIQTVAKQLGTVKVQVVPFRLALVLSAILEVVTSISKTRNPLPKEGILVVSKGVLVSSELAKQDLGISFRPFEETIRDAISFAKASFTKG